MKISTLLFAGRLSSPRVVLASMANLRDRFRTKAGGHNPSPEQWLALEDLVSCLDAQVTGQTEQAVYLCSLDPGIGKTSALASYLDTLLAQDDEPYRSCGVLVAMNTLDEIEGFIREVGIPREMLGVWTSKEELNCLGRHDISNARVLITTHERVTRELKDVPLWSAQSLYYQGQVRKLRVWDEAFMPGHPISLNVDDVLSVLRTVRHLSLGMRNQIKATFDEIESLPNGTVYQVSDYLTAHDITIDEMLEAANALDPKDETSKRLNDAQAEIMTGLALVSGKTVKVRLDGRYGNATVDFHETLPSDLAPILVLDASGRPGVRVTYDDMEKERHLVRRLKTAPKSYRNLTVHVWNRGGGKAAWKDSGDDLLDGMVRTILKKPDQEWLIIHHKPGRGVPDVVKELAKRLSKAVFAKLHFRNWGKHKATNKYSHVTNIILAGMLHMRPSQSEARKRLAVGLKPADGDFTEAELKLFELGEHADNILQALCRAGVRVSEGDTCLKCDAYIITSVHSGIAKALPAIFPKCNVKQWQPIKVSLSGHAAKAFGMIESWLKNAGPDDVLKFADISSALGITRVQFKDIRKDNKRFRDAVAGLGVKEWGPNVYFVGYRKEAVAEADRSNLESA